MLYFFPRQLPKLQPFSVTERLAIIQIAQESMPLPRRFFANTIKILVLGLLFYSLVSVEGWLWRVLSLVAAVAAYPLLFQPITLSLIGPYLDTAIKRFRAQQEDSEAEQQEDEPQ
ncbi:DUF6170 family protein [Idiomarina xiamenensis]|uniref:Uncharacterized protein n=1 Tax=Idiomarina xiamenensis 10-D-4 TaxID=740709 RepID=K2KT42_9GAMM|nr:DUF6170 family protein [Idiomarina xiamenensis]EKE80800.1 hypothetical protein A10D4_11319 [Idiomarina xiamenensis 10-D-4]